MNRNTPSILVCALFTGAGLVGCTADRDFSSDFNPRASQLFAPSPTPAKQVAESKPVEQPKAAPKAAEQPKAKPTEQPKPAATGDGLVRTATGFPTGERSTSAVWLERTAPAEVVAGQDFQYTYTVTNLTNTTLHEVALKDMCASGFTVTSSNPQTLTPAPNLAWNLGDLNAGEKKVVTVNGKAAGVGTITSCATVTYNSLLCINTNVVKPALAITKSGPAEVTLCDSWPYELTVSNSGSGAARDVKVTDNLPAGVKTTDGKTSVEYSIPSLAGGESKKMTVMVKADKAGAFTNSASASAAGGLTAESGKVTTTVRQPVVAVKAECPAGGITGRGGRDLTFKFTVTNKGDAACNNTVVNAPVPAGSTFASADNGGTNTGGNVSWKIGSLAPGASKTVALTVKAAVAGTLNASVSAECACSQKATDQCSTSLTGVPDIGTLLTDDTGVVPVGDNHSFRYEVKNQGLVDLTNLKVVFTLDPGLEFVSSDWKTPAKASGKTVTVDVGTVPPGQTIKFNLVTKGVKTGELYIHSETTCTEIKRANQNDEQVNYIDR